MPDVQQRKLKGIEIWEALISHLWCDVCALIQICLDEERAGRIPTITNPRFGEYFRIDKRNYRSRVLNMGAGIKVPNPYLPHGSEDDEHLRIGLFRKHKEKNFQPRLACLVINAFHQSREGHLDTGTSELIPSPLWIIYQFLTDPENLASAGYAFLACRNWLCDMLRVQARPPTKVGVRTSSSKNSNGAVYFEASDLSSAIASFENHDEIQIRWPDPRARSRTSDSKVQQDEARFRTHNFIGHLLALKGYSHLWFRKEKGSLGVRAFLSFDSKLRQSNGLERKLRNRIAKQLEVPHFRKSKTYRSFPDFEELANQAFGVPLPIRGMNIVFNDGLRASDGGGLVISIVGKPGTGKTSLSLAIADALAPFGIPTLFVALEETEGDIKNKLKTIGQYGHSRLSVTRANDERFVCIDSAGALIKDFESLKAQTLELYQRTEIREETGKEGRVLPIAGVVIIDNVNMLGHKHDHAKDRDSDIREIEEMIREWRKANLISILISAEDVAAQFRLDYLADVVVDLRYVDLDSMNNKPVRMLSIVKTRHQSARQGAHVFHMTSGKGFRVAPHMDSLMAKKENLLRRLPDKSRHIDIFATKERSEKRPYLDLYPMSNVLVHGFGSGGKAGLALKLLLTQPSENPRAPSAAGRKGSGYDRHNHAQPRVLIISFLYPEEYYAGVIQDIRTGLNGRSEGATEPKVDYLVFAPGYFMPQDFLNKVVSRLDMAVVAGRPFTGVMIDGLHNVFLQYEKLQDSSVVWAMLYSILSRYSATVVSTFTNFVLNERHLSTSEGAEVSGLGASVPEHQALQKGMIPFLHALVKAADFYLYLQEEVVWETNARLYVLSVRSTIGKQSVPDEYLFWNRQKQNFTKRVTAGELRKLLFPEPFSLSNAMRPREQVRNVRQPRAARLEPGREV